MEEREFAVRKLFIKWRELRLLIADGVTFMSEQYMG